MGIIMRNDKFRLELLEKRTARLALIDAWVNSTCDTYLLSELSWLRGKVLTVRTAPKEQQKLMRDKEQQKAIKKYTRESIKGGVSHKQPWTAEEDQKVINTRFSDQELAKELGRSYAATQKRRHKLRQLGLVPNSVVDIVPVAL